MNENQMIVAFCIGFPVFCFLLAGLMVVFVRRAQTIVCPNCQERFPQTDITEEGVACPHCEWRLVGVTENAPSRELLE